MPVFYVQAPYKPDVNAFLDSILEKVDFAYRKSDSTPIKLMKIKNYFKEYRLKVLIIDEIHNILAGSKLKQKEFMNALKNLINEIKRPVVLVGTKDALIATDTDYQISSRFPPKILSTWTYDENYLSFLVAFEKTLPLEKKSNLAGQEKLARKILEMSEGYLGEIVSILKELAVLAIKTGKEKIDESLLKEIDWIPPSERRKIYYEKL